MTIWLLALRTALFGRPGGPPFFFRRDEGLGHIVKLAIFSRWGIGFWGSGLAWPPSNGITAVLSAKCFGGQTQATTQGPSRKYEHNARNYMVSGQEQTTSFVRPGQVLSMTTERAPQWAGCTKLNEKCWTRCWPHTDSSHYLAALIQITIHYGKQNKKWQDPQRRFFGAEEQEQE